MKSPREIIAEAIRPGMVNPNRASEAAEAAIGAMLSAGFIIVRRRPLEGAAADRVGPAPRPVLTNAIAGDGDRRGVYPK